jgi:hypothetical protein
MREGVCLCDGCDFCGSGGFECVEQACSCEGSRRKKKKKKKKDALMNLGDEVLGRVIDLILCAAFIRGLNTGILPVQHNKQHVWDYIACALSLTYLHTSTQAPPAPRTTKIANGR